MAKPPPRKPKKKVCQFCKEKISYVDYKDTGLLRKFISDRGKIRARRVTGNCTQHQRDVATAVKNAREMALLPYASRVTTQRSSRDRGERGERGGRPPRNEEADLEAPETACPEDLGSALGRPAEDRLRRERRQVEAGRRVQELRESRLLQQILVVVHPEVVGAQRERHAAVGHVTHGSHAAPEA